MDVNISVTAHIIGMVLNVLILVTTNHAMKLQILQKSALLHHGINIDAVALADITGGV